MLRNRRYVGDFTWGVHPQGKRHRFGVGGLSQTVRHDRKGPRRNPADAWLVCPDSHEPLVDRDLFERVRARLSKNRTLTTPHPAGGSFVLNRLMVCGQCGSRLCGVTSYGTREYICRGYLSFGKAYCFRNKVREKAILDFLIRRLHGMFLDPGNQKALRTEIASQEARERSGRNLDRMGREVAELEEKIRRGNERLVILPADRIPGVVEQIRAWERERNEVAAELRRVQTDSPVDRLEKIIAEAEAVLWRLQDALKESDYPLLREVLGELIDRFELNWTQDQRGKATYTKLQGGVVFLAGHEGLWKLFPSADRRRY